MRPDGEIRWVRVRGFKIRNAADVPIRHVGIVTDITEQKASATALRTSLAEFRMLAESMPQIVWITRADGWNTYFSQQWVDYTGLSLEESMGDGWITRFHPDDKVHASEAWREATATGRIYSTECRLRSAQGEYHWWLIRGVPIRDGAGQILKWFGTCTDIQELKLAELAISRTNDALEQQQTELRALIDMVPAMIVFKDTNNVFRRVNRRLAESLGKSVAELEGKLSEEIFPQQAKRYDAEDLIVTASGLPEKGVVKRGRNREGEEVWHQIDKVPVKDNAGKVVGLVVMAQDITERKRAELALQTSEKRFKALFEQAAVGVALLDATTGQFVQINQRFCEFLGRTAPEMLALTFHEVTHPADLERGVTLTEQIKSGLIREFTQEKRYLKKDGTPLWATLTVSPLWATGETPDYFIAVAQDVGERKRLEDQIRQAQKMEAVGTLAGGIAHDFNNLLAAICGYTELSQLTLEGNAEVRAHLEAIRKTSHRATNLVRQILTFSRQQTVERRPIQLLPVLAEALTLLRATIPSTIEFETSLPSNAPTVLADPTQVHQMLVNLGTNAWHAMKNQPGRLRVTLERCEVDATHAATQARLRPGLYARVSVSDTGSGMTEAIQRRIFEPFFTTKPPGEGTGLGLAVVHGIMETHEGAITVYSQPWEGTVFHLYFPAHAGETAAAPADADDIPRGRGERILFVDDEELLVELGQKALTALGYEVEGLTQPIAALALLRTEPHRFALVITDQTMPRMTGFVLAGELQQIRPGLPIILSSGYSQLLTSESVAAAGIRDVLLKPFTIHSLGHAVHAALHPPPLPHKTYGSNSPY